MHQKFSPVVIISCINKHSIMPEPSKKIKGFLFFLFLSVFCTGYANAQAFYPSFSPSLNRPALLWQKCLGGTKEDIANAIVLAADGGIVIAGDSKSDDGDVTGHHGSTDFKDGWVVKLSSAREIQWQVSLGGTADDVINGIIQTNDGGFLCVGNAKSTDGDITAYHGLADAWLVKLSANGQVSWSKTYGGSGTDEGVSVIQLQGSEVNYAVAATSNSRDGDVSAINSLYDSNGWFFKINGNGEIVWEKSIDQEGEYANGNNIAMGLVQINDGSLIACISGKSRLDTMFVDFNYSTENYDTTRIYDSIYPGILYRINADNGSASYFTQARADGMVSMAYEGNSLFLSYMAHGFRYISCDESWSAIPVYTPHYARVTSQVNLQTGSFLHSYEYLYYPHCSSFDGDDGSNSYYKVPGNAFSQLPFESWVSAGQYFYSGRDAGFRLYDARISGNGFSGMYGGGAYDGFNAVKTMPDGNEFICAGYTNSTQYFYSYDGTLSNSTDVIGLHGAPSIGGLDYPSDFWVTKISLSPNRIFGKVFLDTNSNNNLDAGEPAYKRGMVKIKKYGEEKSYSIDGNGYYGAQADTGLYSVQLFLYDTTHFNSVPLMDTLRFTESNIKDTFNFAVHQLSTFRDYTATLSPLNTARPGLPLYYTITCGNNGTDTFANKPLVFVKDSRLSIDNLSFPGSVISGDTVTWNSLTLLPGESKSLGTISMHITPPPGANIDDTLVSYVLIDSIEDGVSADNYFVLKQPVLGSYDPNDKIESHAGSITRSEIKNGHYLEYTIYFQNTGKDTAFNVVIGDSLDPNLIHSTFETVASSHFYHFKIEKERFVTWILAGINLVDSVQNEPASHGYITYRIKPKNNLVIGDVIHNSASIYFDYNAPVQTNTQKTTIIKTTAVWTGAIDSLWNNPGNWNINVVPDSETVVIIPANVPHYPAVNINAICFALRVDKNATVTIQDGYNLNITGK